MDDRDAQHESLVEFFVRNSGKGSGCKYKYHYFQQGQWKRSLVSAGSLPILFISVLCCLISILSVKPVQKPARTLLDSWDSRNGCFGLVRLLSFLF